MDAESDDEVSSKKSTVRAPRPPNRKLLRKQGRQLKRMKKRAYSMHAPIPQTFQRPSLKRKPTVEEVEGLEKRKLKKESDEMTRKLLTAKRKAEESKQKKEKARIQRLLEENAEEDKLIRNLEKKLHLKKKKRNKQKQPVDAVPTSFANDGLGYLLEVLNKTNPGEQDSPESEGTEFAEDDDDDDMEQEEDESTKTAKADLIDDQSSDCTEPVIKEDIYGRFKDQQGNILPTDKYIPPSLKHRAEGVDHSESRQMLRRQIKGLLNRLTQSTLANVLNQVLELFRINSRHDMNECLCEAVLDSVTTRARVPKRLALEHAMFMGLLYQNAGAETGAVFVQKLVEAYDAEVTGQPDSTETDKKLDNIATLFCYAFTFRVVHSSMIFELLREFVERFTERDIDVILLILREVGFSLRKNDPAALKNLVEAVQTKADNLRAEKPDMGSRLSFMLDTLQAIRNNNVTKMPNYDNSEQEHAVKIYRSLLRKGQNVESELKMSLGDLRNADQRGRWWIVGAAWSDNNQVNQESDQPLSGQLVVEEGVAGLDQRLLQLAVKQRMNTDIRKAIFCAVMSAEDYNEAFEHVLKLNLKTAQEGEIIHVLLHCCLQERSFNPFYALVLEKFCISHRRFQRLCLYALWDKMRDLGQLSTGQQQRNLAHVVAHALLAGGIPITVLKKLNFADMNAELMKFLRILLSRVVLLAKESELRTVFGGVSESKYRSFRESLRLFVRHFMMRNAGKILKGEFAGVEKSVFEKRILVCEKALLGESGGDLT